MLLILIMLLIESGAVQRIMSTITIRSMKRKNEGGDFNGGSSAILV